MQIRLHLPGTGSLKEKRSVIRSILDRMKQKFNVSAIEAAEQDKWQTAVLAVACVSAHSAQAHRQLEQVLAFVESNPSVQVYETDLEIL
ncbi:MAG: DUF503 domain-containing protein [Bacillota bacterium]|nr:DUF503 domain-containing protein [Bacillota bacterium]MDW7682532.1 DUF503 domain-containing protein [Bacillota bacterium]